jgi:hypothetical protein
MATRRGLAGSFISPRFPPLGRGSHPGYRVILSVFESAGAAFTNGDEPGVKLKKKGKRK